jgi:hypothetical protein
MRALAFLIGLVITVALAVGVLRAWWYWGMVGLEGHPVWQIIVIRGGILALGGFTVGGGWSLLVLLPGLWMDPIERFLWRCVGR